MADGYWSYNRISIHSDGIPGPESGNHFWNAIDRGISLGVVIGAVFSGPMMGPIIGGFVAENLNWRWNLWLMIIAGFAMALICALFLEESYIPRALVKKAKRIRKETGNYKLKTELEEAGIDIHRIVSVYLVRPWSKLSDYSSKYV